MDDGTLDGELLEKAIKNIGEQIARKNSTLATEEDDDEDSSDDSPLKESDDDEF